MTSFATVETGLDKTTTHSFFRVVNLEHRQNINLCYTIANQLEKVCLTDIMYMQGSNVSKHKMVENIYFIHLSCGLHLAVDHNHES